MAAQGGKILIGWWQGLNQFIRMLTLEAAHKAVEQFSPKTRQAPQIAMPLPFRFATKWSGTDLATVTQQKWQPQQEPLSWDGFEWPLTGMARTSGLQQMCLECCSSPSTALSVLFLTKACMRQCASAKSCDSCQLSDTRSCAYAAGPMGSVQTRTGQGGLPLSILRLAFHEGLKSASGSTGCLAQYAKAAEPQQLHALLRQSVRAMRWLHNSMVQLDRDQRPHGHLSPLAITKQLDFRAQPWWARGTAGRAQPVQAKAKAKAEAEELCRAAKDAVLLDRTAEMFQFLVDRVYSRTPEQRAAEDSDACELVSLDPPPKLSGGCKGFLSGNERQQLHTTLQLSKGDSLWLSACPGPEGPSVCQQLSNVLRKGQPLRVESSEPCSSGHALLQDMVSSRISIDGAVQYTAGHKQYGFAGPREQPYFLLGTKTSIKPQDSCLLVVEKVSINIGGYLLKVCVVRGKDKVKRCRQEDEINFINL